MEKLVKAIQEAFKCFSDVYIHELKDLEPRDRQDLMACLGVFLEFEKKYKK